MTDPKPNETPTPPPGPAADALAACELAEELDKAATRGTGAWMVEACALLPFLAGRLRAALAEVERLKEAADEKRLRLHVADVVSRCEELARENAALRERVASLEAGLREVLASFANHKRCHDDAGLSPYIRENGRHTGVRRGSPWAELCDDAKRAAALLAAGEG